MPCGEAKQDKVMQGARAHERVSGLPSSLLQETIVAAGEAGLLNECHGGCGVSDLVTRYFVAGFNSAAALSMPSTAPASST